MNGPYEIFDKEIRYLGNNIFSASDIQGYLGAQLNRRHMELRDRREYWGHLLIIDSVLNRGLHRCFSEELKACQVDLPLLTRSISSPGALGEKPSIISDVKPFELPYFNHDVPIFLSQSSQLYLEAYVLMTELDRVYIVGKSFRNEASDFRHLTEFRHAEYEAFGCLEDILTIQERMIRFLIQELVVNCEASLRFFLSEEDFNALDLPAGQFTRITFDEAFSELYRVSKDSKYCPDCATIVNFDATAEVLLTNLVGDTKPIFVTHYPLAEVAFYHAVSSSRPTRALNADLLFPGYGEVIGSGQRIFTKADYEHKRDMFRLKPDDYDWYGEIRQSERNTTAHSGFGLGVERFLAALLKLPTLVQVISFPRVHWAIRP